MSWLKVLPDVWRYRDSCNVWAIKGPEGILFVDAGTGEWVRTAGELGDRPAALACTHYFRDHAAGASAAARAKIPIWVPEG
jgi:glyoxylase-like metal-dependent hydrolase (beta-lactamase superfamily II)